MTVYKRIFWIVADSLGVGEAPDAARFNDTGANTLESIIRATGGLNCPTLKKLGLAHVLNSKLWPTDSNPVASHGKMAEKSPGKDTPTGHWEMAGVPLSFEFPVFSNGFPEKLLSDFISRTEIPGVLGNVAASGTEIIKDFGEESIRSGKPILYTSGDSVFQIAAHETHFGLDRLYKCCEIARKLCDDYKIGRVIARPFLGDTASNFKRTTNRHDYAVPPPGPTILNAAHDAGLRVIALGKITDIFSGLGITESIKTISNDDGMQKIMALARQKDWNGIAFLNLVDFDSLYGHRRDPAGYRNALENLDPQLAQFLEVLSPDDAMIITADHGCDPTFRGSDHTREHVPIIWYRKNFPVRDLGTRKGFDDIAATVSDFFNLHYAHEGKSFHE